MLSVSAEGYEIFDFNQLRYFKTKKQLLQFNILLMQIGNKFIKDKKTNS